MPLRLKLTFTPPEAATVGVDEAALLPSAAPPHGLEHEDDYHHDAHSVSSCASDDSAAEGSAEVSHGIATTAGMTPAHLQHILAITRAVMASSAAGVASGKRPRQSSEVCSARPDAAALDAAILASRHRIRDKRLRGMYRLTRLKPLLVRKKSVHVDSSGRLHSGSAAQRVVGAASACAGSNSSQSFAAAARSLPMKLSEGTQVACPCCVSARTAALQAQEQDIVLLLAALARSTVTVDEDAALLARLRASLPAPVDTDTDALCTLVCSDILQRRAQLRWRDAAHVQDVYALLLPDTAQAVRASSSAKEPSDAPLARRSNRMHKKSKVLLEDEDEDGSETGGVLQQHGSSDDAGIAEEGGTRAAGGDDAQAQVQIETALSGTMAMNDEGMMSAITMHADDARTVFLAAPTLVPGTPERPDGLSKKASPSRRAKSVHSDPAPQLHVVSVARVLPMAELLTAPDASCHDKHVADEAPAKPAEDLLPHAEHVSMSHTRTRRSARAAGCVFDEEEAVQYLLRVQYHAPFEVVDIPGRGRTVLARGFLPRGCFVAEYAGQLIPGLEASRRETLYAQGGFGSYMFYFSHNEQRHCVDATAERREYGVARLIAHSRRAPNLIVRKLIVDGVPRLALMARRDIQYNEELVYDYGEWDDDVLRAFKWLRDS